MQTDIDFPYGFRALSTTDARAGYEPLRWQYRLFERFCRNDIPLTCELPTGLGKTSVILLWVLALRRQLLEGRCPRLPTRLVYVVDRRTVVDQATAVAEGIRKNLGSLALDENWLAVSTLRGQLADNREWTIDPSRPAIIIGTVDMIGSRLLFSGYRSSYKLRPLEAGLLGQDTLLVLDEAHLSQPFAKLIRALSDRGDFQRGQGMPMRIMYMSATNGTSDPDGFRLGHSDLEGTAEENPIVQRYEAKKWLTVHSAADRKTVLASIVRAASELAGDNARVVVFVKRPDDAVDIKTRIQKEMKLSPGAIEVLTGTMRGLERDELLRSAVLKRFLDGDEKPEDRAGKGPAVLVSTSAGEVGFDLNADHMVCDAAPLDSMIQRLGRVNRRGYGGAAVEVFPESERSAKKDSSDKRKGTFEAATAEAINCLRELPQDERDGTYDASPRALAELRTRIGAVRFESACAPRPTTVELTDILLDRWSMTTITAPMSGRPPVGPWLRGVEHDAAETVIVWRAELDLDGFEHLDPEDVNEWFDAHRILPYETLCAPAEKVKAWMLERWNRLAGGSQDTVGDRPCVVDRGGLQLYKIRHLVELLQQKGGGPTVEDAQIVLPALFGGIRRGEGLLDAAEPDPGGPGASKCPDVADEGGLDAHGHSRYRMIRTVDEGGEREAPVTGGFPEDRSGFSQYVLDLPGRGDTQIQLISLAPKRERVEDGTRKQALSAHVGLVEQYASDICGRLGLSDSIIRTAVEHAAAWHDNGKDRELWQTAADRRPDDPPLGKCGTGLRRVRGGYRHEFGSLREFNEQHEGRLPDDVFDLAMHLIAAHHGRARPHFPKGGFDPDARGKSPQAAADVIRRFARLQRSYGHWHLAWIEDLLRCADAMASRRDEDS